MLTTGRGNLKGQNLRVYMMVYSFMVFNATFNNISVISWRSVLLVEETRGLYSSPRTEFELTTLVVIGTDCIGSCKSNYHTITATTTPLESVHEFNWMLNKGNNKITELRTILQRESPNS